MKFTRKLTAVLLLAALAAVSLTGCFGKNEGSADTDTDTDAPDTVQSDSEEILPDAEAKPQETDPVWEKIDPVVTEAPAPAAPETEPVQKEPEVYEVIPEPQQEVPDDTGDEDTEDEENGETETEIMESPVRTGTAYAKGQFVSTQSPKLFLLLDWSLVKLSDGKVAMDVSASLSSYAIYCNEKFEMNTFSVGGEEKTFSSPEIAYDGDTRRVFPLASETFILEGNEEYLPVSATWQMLGTYSGLSIDSLVAEGVIDLLDLPEEWLVNP